VASVGFSPDGKLIVSASVDQTIKLWNAEAGKEVKTLPGNHGSVNSIFFSRDGMLVARAGTDDTIKIWNVETGAEVKTLEGHAGATRSVSFSPDGRQIIGVAGNAIRIWNAGTGAEVKTLIGHSDSIRLVAFSSNGNLIVSGSWEGMIEIWNAETGEAIRTLKGHSDAVESVTFSPDGKYIVSGSSDRDARNPFQQRYDQVVKIWNSKTGEEIRSLIGHAGSVHSVAFSPDGKRIVTASSDKTIKIWDAESGKEIRTLKGHSSLVNSAAFSPDGKQIVSGGFDHSIKVWDAQTGAELRSLTGRTKWVVSVSFTQNGKQIVTETMGGEFHNERSTKLLDLESGSEIKNLFESTRVRFSADNKQVFIEGSDEVVRLWNSESRIRIKTAGGGDVALSPDGNQIAGIASDYAIELWNIKSGTEVKTLRFGDAKQIYRIAFSSDGKHLALASVYTTIRLLNVETGEVRSLIGHSNSVYSVAFSPDGKYLASGSWDGTVRLWNVDTGEEVKTLRGHSSVVASVSFSPSGKQIVSGSWDETIKVWDAETGAEIETLRGHSNIVESVAFSPNGKYIVSGSRDTKTKIWAVDTGKELASVIAFDQNDWVVATPDGRFDTNRLEDLQVLHWILPDSPFTPLSFEIFMRDYYEPKLLSRLLKCTEQNNCNREFKPVRDLSTLNRTQSKVEILRVSPTDSPDTVEVSVGAEDVVSDYQKDSRGRQLTSGAYDLRLFRNGQLVGHSTSDEKLLTTFKTYKNFDDELAVWRDANRVDLVDGRKNFTFSVRLPADSKAKQVEFSAYAFNEDRVKSETARRLWPLDEGAKTSSVRRNKPRAYVIAVGVNANENPGFDLQFAANDARRFQEVLPQRLAATGEYSEVIPISLISDWELRRGQKVVTKRDATKVNFKAVLDLLAGRPVPDEIKRAIPNADKLAKSTPDDMVLILFSSHGYADQSGNFYFIPYDTGPGACSVFTETVQQRSISSDELSLWLRDVDAGQMTLIVDACYSTAAIEGSGFKPGPMGSRGLGQLAYDKRMRILTATQADNVAMELPATAAGQPINHGLLSYALLEDGLGANKADFKPQDKTIFLDEWLEYAVADVPKLFANQPRSLNETQPASRQRNDRPRLVLLKRQLADPGACGPAPSAGASRTQEQQPSLFDFTRRKREVALVRNP
jgi:WD40 repeat protein